MRNSDRQTNRQTETEIERVGQTETGSEKER